ncbi:MAG: helix-turn-helix domain-containing protein [Eubacteriales bacterium]
MLRDEVRQALNEFTQLPAKDADNDLLNIQEVAQMLNLAVPSIYGLVHRRQIPYIKRGKKLIFEKSQVEQWLKNGRQKTVYDAATESDEYLFRKNHLEAKS